MTTLFDINPQLDRQIEAYNNRTPEGDMEQITKVLMIIFLFPESTSREISARAKIERTSVCRVLAENKTYFDASEQVEYIQHGKCYHPSAYKLTKIGIEKLKQLVE